MLSLKSRRIIFIAPLLLLMIPLIGMFISNEVNWTGSDFVIGGLILYFFATLVYLVLGKFKTFKSRLIILLMLFVTFLLVWGELAVGIFGTPFAGS